MKERTQQQVEEAKVLLQVAEQQASDGPKRGRRYLMAELVEKQNASKAMLVEAQAEADAQLAKAKARAEEIAAVGAAEASAIQAKGQAEALVLKEKNQTYQYMGEAGITDIVMNKMPEIAGAIAAPMSKTEKMVFISQDDATGSKVTKDIIKTIATLPDAVEGLTGLDLKNAIAKATAALIRRPSPLPSCNDPLVSTNGALSWSATTVLDSGSRIQDAAASGKGNDRKWKWGICLGMEAD